MLKYEVLDQQIPPLILSVGLVTHSEPCIKCIIFRHEKVYYYWPRPLLTNQKSFAIKKFSRFFSNTGQVGWRDLLRKHIIVVQIQMVCGKVQATVRLDFTIYLFF